MNHPPSMTWYHPLAMKIQLKMNLQPNDISVAHRLGPKKTGVNRPIICKFVRRSTKSCIIHKCITLKPDLYANEHLTPPRRNIFTKLLKVKKSTKLITQLHTKDGKIFMRLKDSPHKFGFTDEESLVDILNEENPFLLNQYKSASLVSAHPNM